MCYRKLMATHQVTSQLVATRLVWTFESRRLASCFEWAPPPSQGRSWSTERSWKSRKWSKVRDKTPGVAGSW